MAALFGWSYLVLNIEFLNLIWLSSLYVPRDSLFIMTQFLSQIYIVYLMYYLTNYYFLIFHYYAIVLIYCINNFLSFFWRYTSLLRYFVIIFICSCFWITQWWTSWDFCNAISNFITNQRQLLLLFFEFSFLKQF